MVWIKLLSYLLVHCVFIEERIINHDLMLLLFGCLINQLLQMV